MALILNMRDLAQPVFSFERPYISGTKVLQYQKTFSGCCNTKYLGCNNTKYFQGAQIPNIIGCYHNKYFQGALIQNILGCYNIKYFQGAAMKDILSVLQYQIFCALKALQYSFSQAV